MQNILGTLLAYINKYMYVYYITYMYQDNLEK